MSPTKRVESSLTREPWHLAAQVMSHVTSHHDGSVSTAVSYSQAVKAAGLIFVSGTGPVDPTTGRIVEGPVQAQVAQCLRNISAILEAAGSHLGKAVSATLIVADKDDFAPVNEEWLRWFPGDPPARQGGLRCKLRRAE